MVFYLLFFFCFFFFFVLYIKYFEGEVCVDILKAAWSPVWTLACLCHAIISLLADPNPDSPLNCDAGMWWNCLTN